MHHTVDTLLRDQTGWRRWFRLPYVAFIIPITGADAVAQIGQWQQALRPRLGYEPLDVARLHITLHYVGDFRTRWGHLRPRTWSRPALDAMAQRVRPVFDALPAFEVGLGPLNAFPGALVAEVQDDSQCLRALNTRLRRCLPLRARPLLPWSYLPHVTLGYWGRQPVSDVKTALQPYRNTDVVRCTLETVKFTIYYCDAVPHSPRMLNEPREEIIAEYALAAE